MATQQIITGRVVSVNEKGLKLDGQESWFNVSRFAENVVLPERGATVTVTLDKAGFLRAVETAAAAPLQIAGGSDEPSVKDRTITRLAVLKAAAEFGAARPSLKSGDILKIAASWERWVLRDADTEDLTDAF